MYYKWVERIPLKMLPGSLTLKLPYKKIAVKMNADKWIDTQDSVIAVFSVHSTFHENEKGQLNVEVFISLLKKYVQGKIIIMMTDVAHLNVFTLVNGIDKQKALEKINYDAKSLVDKFAVSFQECKIEFWHNFINRDLNYQSSGKQIKYLYQTDKEFRELLHQDAEKTYTDERAQECPNKALFMSKATEDLLEQCVYPLVVAKKGYKFSFYPGKQYDSVQYVIDKILTQEQKTSFVHVNISFEKK